MRWCVSLILGVAGAAMAGCSSATGPVTQTYLRSVNGSPNGPPLDIYVYGSRIVLSLPYAASTSYINIGSGPATVSVTATGDSASLSSTPTKFANHHWYTLLVLGAIDSLGSSILVDSTTAPADSARLRFVNGSPSSPSVDVYVKPMGDSTPPKPTFAGVAFRSATAYLSESPASYEVVVTSAGSKTVVLDDTLANVSGAAVRTVIALDHPGGGAPLTAVNLANPG
jgi:hypothetical protein